MSSFIKLFNRALTGNDYPNYKELLELGVNKGYLIHESCNTNEVKDFLDTKPDKTDFSSTFYKTWEDIKTLDRFDIFCHQVLYYFTRININDFTPHENELPKVLSENLKPILPITVEEACAKCEKMLSSGIALSKDTIKCIFDVYDKCEYKNLNINNIKNIEAKIIAYKKLDKLPSDVTEFLRYLIYLSCEETLLIKSKETLTKITKSNFDVSGLIKTFGVAKLSSIYGRYKLIFMAFKHANKSNVTVINNLTKKSKSKANKRPKVSDDESNYFQKILSDQGTLNEEKLINKLNYLNNFKKIALLETINLYLALNQDYRVFGIRNGKIWVKMPEDKIKELEPRYRKRKDKEVKITFPLPFKKYKKSKQPIMGCKDYERLSKIYQIIYGSFISVLRSNCLKNNIKGFKLPDKCNLTAPRSEKAFVGEYPFGSWLSLVNSDLVIGVSWTDEDNVADLDLSLMDMNNQKIGWNSHFRNESSTILFSGDVVEAPGTELIYASKGFDSDFGVYLNQYRVIRDGTVSYKFFIAREKITEDQITRTYMINPNSVCFSTKLDMESKEMLIGFITKGRFIFSTFRTNESRVARSNEYSKKLIHYNLVTQKCHLEVKKILKDLNLVDMSAGDNSIAKEQVFTFQSKSEIIEFFKN